MLEGKTLLDDSVAAAENDDLPIENFLNRLQQPKPAVQARPRFAETLQEVPNMTNSVSLQRKQADSQMIDMTSANQITLPDKTPDLNAIQIRDFGEDLPPPTLEEIAQMGLMDGDNGRRLFDIITEQEERIEVRRTEEEEVLSTPNPQIRMTSFNGQQNLMEDLQDSTLAPQIPPTAQEEQPPIPMEIQEQPQVASDPSITDGMRESLYVKRLDIIVNTDAVENEEQRPKVKRKARVPRNRGVHAAGSETTLSKPMPQFVATHTRRSTPNVVKYKVNYHHFDYFAENDDECPEDDYELAPFNYAEVMHGMEVIHKEHIEPIDEPAPKKRRNESPPEAENASKKNKTDEAVGLSTLEPPILDLASLPIMEFSAPIADSLAAPLPPQLDNSVAVMPPQEVPEIPNEAAPENTSEVVIRQSADAPVTVAPLARTSTPLITTMPLVSSSPLVRSMFHTNLATNFQSLRNKKMHNDSSMVTRKDYEYNRLNEIGQQTAPPAEASLAIPAEVSNVSTEAPNVPKMYKEFRKNCIDCVMWEAEKKKCVYYEEYNIENMMLYMQIRKYMKAKNKWKVLVNEVIDKLKLFDTNSKWTIVRRLWLLCDYKLLTGHWAEDDELNLLEIEIPVRQNVQQEGEDKENVN